MHLLLDLGQIVASTCSDHGSLEVVNEGPFEVLLGVDGVASNSLARVLLAIILGDPDWLKILRVGFLDDVGSEGGEAVVIVIIVVPVGTVPSPCLDDAPCITAIIDLLPKINRGSVLEAGLGWSFALRPCIPPVARWASDCCTSCSTLPRVDVTP
jgi:hypothetical protein